MVKMLGYLVEVCEFISQHWRAATAGPLVKR